MSENRGQWRCPYCDGLNAWQDEVCQVCGDGHRAEAVASAKLGDASGQEMPKNNMPRERAEEMPRSAPAPEPMKSGGGASPETKPPKKKGLKGVLVALVIAALAYGGGQLLGGQFARSFKPEAGKAPAPTAAIVQVTAIPVLTEIPTRTPTQAPALTEAPTQAPTEAPASAQTGYWNFRDCSDAEIDAVLAQFWYGEDSARGVWCAMFMDQEAMHGGLLSYDAGEEHMLFMIGTLSEDSDDDETLFVTYSNGERHNIKLRMTEGPDAFKLVTADDRRIDLELRRGESKKSLIRGAILKVVHGETSGGDASDSVDDFELKKGSQGEEVRKLQQGLIKMGFLSGSADGIFGSQTEVAVRAFQTSYGFSPSGVVGRKQYKIILEEGGIAN